MCGTNVLDKDGISACVVLAELACYLAQNGVTLTQQLEHIFNKYVKCFPASPTILRQVLGGSHGPIHDAIDRDGANFLPFMG